MNHPKSNYVSYQVWNRVQINNEIKAKNEERPINLAAQILIETYED
ncbi:hypothetical protein [Legionella nautarum]|nr:hypothetical protein [Legionella nautarum]